MSIETLFTRSRVGALLITVLAVIGLLIVNTTDSTAGEPDQASASCELTNVTSTASWVFQGGFVSGEGIYTFFNPEEDCGTSPYPYEITDFQFMLGGSTDEVSLDIVVYDAAVSGDSCDGPGVELYRRTIQAQGADDSPNEYSFFPGELCVNGPFFMGLEFQHSGVPGPGRQGDSPPLADECENYIWTGGDYVDAINLGMIHYPAFWIFGETGQCQVPGACCDPYGGCSINTQAACEALGGVYMGDGTDCDPNPCSPAFGCTMTNTTGDDSWVIQAGFVAGEGYYTFCNPEEDCGSPAYPFELSAFRFMLGGSSATVDVDIVVYDMRPAGDSCDGPTTELCRFTTSATGNDAIPNVFEFPPGQCCVNGPFFIGLEFHHSGLPGPGGELSGPTADRCENWIMAQPGSVLYDAYLLGVTRYPGYWVYGEPEQCQESGACCDPFGECSINSQAECESLGRVYMGDGTDCDPNPCSPAFGCTMTNTTGDDSWAFQAGFVTGEGHYTFYNPEEDCGSPAYPFELNAFRFMFGGSSATEDVDVVIYDIVPAGDSCDGPGAELFRFTTSATGNDATPSLFEFPSGQCCVDRPFFIGLEFHHSGLPGTGRESSGPTAQACENWILTQPGSVFYDASLLGATHYPGYWVYGEPETTCREPGACCDPFNFCTVETQAECDALGGSYAGDGTTCEPNPCGPGGDCAMTNVTPTSSWVFQAGFVSGEGLFTFFNPAEDCGTSVYPYEITDFQFMLGGSTDEVSLDIVVYDAAVSGDSCDGPGTELYRRTVMVQAADESPFQHSFASGELCVDRPFFMGLEFQHSGLPGPARQGDNPPLADGCENYIWTGGGYYDAIDFGFIHYPAFWIFGDTEHCGGCCGRYTGGITGNANCSVDGKLTLSDITRLIDRVYISKEALCCEASGNTNGSTDCKITLSDITVLIDAVYISKAPPAACMPECET